MTTEQSELNDGSVSEHKTVTSEAPISDVDSTAPADKQHTSLWVKLMIILLFLCFAALAGVMYWGHTTMLHWQAEQTLQQQDYAKTLANSSRKAMEKVTSLGVTQQQNIQNQLSQVHQENAVIAATLQTLSERRPNDWLLAEANYLITLAGHKLWLERDTPTAIKLLETADQRISTLRLPNLLPVREAIHQDIATLKLIPADVSTQLALSVKGLMDGIASLTLLTFQLPEEIDTQENVSVQPEKTWQDNVIANLSKLFDNIIRVKHREAPVAPLISEQQQWLVKQSLRFALEQVYTSILQQDSEQYDAWLIESNRLIGEHFDVSDPAVRVFQHRVSELQNTTISHSLPSDLNAIKAIRPHLEKSAVTPSPKSDAPVNVESN